MYSKIIVLYLTTKRQTLVNGFVTKWRWMTTCPEVPTRQQVSTVRTYFHRNLSSFNMPEVSRFIRKCRGKDETARSNRRVDKNFPAFIPAILAEKSHSPAIVGSSDTEASTRTQRFFAVICTSYRGLCWARVILQNYQVKRKCCTPTWCAASPTIFRVDVSDRGTTSDYKTQKEEWDEKREMRREREREKENRIHDTNANRFIAHVRTMIECILNPVLNRTRQQNMQGCIDDLKVWSQLCVLWNSFCVLREVVEKRF